MTASVYVCVECERRGEKFVPAIFSVVGITKAAGKELESVGFTWARGVGCRGVWYTRDANKILDAIRQGMPWAWVIDRAGHYHRTVQLKHGPAGLE